MAAPAECRFALAAIARALLALAVLIPAFLPGLARGQDRGTLQLIVEPASADLVVGEPLYVILRVRNTGSAAVELPARLRISTGALTVFAANGSEPPHPFRPLALLFSSPEPQRLDPDAEITLLSQLFFGGSGWYVVDREGTYRLHATYRVATPAGTVEVTSEPVTVTVRPGDGAGRLLIDGDQDGEAAKFLHWQAGDHLERGIAHLDAVVARHPGSPVADYIRLAFARSFSRPFKNYSIDRLRPIDCPSALEELQRIRPASLPPLLAVQKSLDHARCLVTLNRRSEASQELDAALRSIAREPAFQPLLDEAVQLEPTLLQ